MKADALVTFTAYSEMEDGDAAPLDVAPDGVAFFFSLDVLEALFGVEYVEEVVKTWTRSGTFERVTDDLARECLEGRAALNGEGTASDPYYIEPIEEGG